MKQSFRRMLSAILAVAMIFSMTVMAIAAEPEQFTEADAGTVTINATDVTLNKSSNEQTANIYIYMDKNVQVGYLKAEYSLSGTGATIGAVSTDSNLPNPVIGDGNLNVTNTTGAYVTKDSKGYLLFTIPVIINSEATGTYTLSVNVKDLTDADTGDGYTLESNTVTATITVEEPSAPPETEPPVETDEFEIYYTLDSNTDGDDAYKNYEIVDDDGNPTTVTATFWLKNNKDETVLQAYDVYVTHDDYLTYTGMSGTGVNGFTGDQNPTDGIKEAHIQFVADKANQRAIGTTDPVELGKIIFTIDSKAAHGEDLPITIRPGSKAAGTNSTNIAIGGTSVGDATSYYPAVKQIVGDVTYSGAEVITTYTVTYNANGGEFEENAVTTQIKQHNVDLTIAAPAVPSREGYSFQGWSTDSSEDNTVNAPTTYTANEDEILYAVWQQDTVTIIFVDEDGTVLDEQTLEYGDDPTPPANPTKVQDDKFTYLFDKWTPDVVAATADATYTATYTATPRTYTIVLNPNDGTYADGYTAPAEYTYGTSTDLPTAEQITKAGYSFGGWYESSDFSGNSVAATGTEATGNKTYYAKWNANTYTITFKDGEGILATVGYNPDLESDIQTLYTASKDGYTFSKWQVSVSDGNWPAVGQDVAASATVTGKYGNITLSAVWTLDEYTITYNLDGGTVAVENKTTYGVDDEPFKLNNPTKTGYTFLGWTGSNGDTLELEVTVTPSTALSNLTYTANWQINSHTVTFKDDDEEVKKETLEYGASVTAPADPSKVGYTFLGWEPAVPSTMPDEDLVFTATWEANTYRIALSPEDGEYVADYTAPTEYTYNTVQKLPGNDDIKKPGYTLVGWYEEETPDDVVTEIKAGTSGDKTYIAKWEANTYTITFNNENDELVQSVPFTFGATTITEPAVPVKRGYSGSWSIYELNKPENQTVTPIYTLVTYTITYDPDNGNATWTETYTIESGVTIASAPENGLYQFNGWKASNAQGGWANGSLVDAGSTHTDKYGSVTLTADWEIPFTYAIEDYKYAYTGYVMLRIATDSAANCYSFSGENMFYTADTNYQLEVEVDGAKEMKNVFVTLIPMNNGKIGDELVTYVEGSKLTAAGMAKLAETEATAVTIDRDGDVNGDGVMNIADANIVYQMVEQQTKGGYYPVTKLDTLARLEADVDTTIRSTTDDHRGSIDDVNVIVNRINGVTI